MKKTVAVIICLALIMIPLVCFAVDTNAQSTNDITLSNTTTQGELVQIQEKSKNKLAEYEAAYGSKSYGLTAYILNGIRIYRQNKRHSQQ